MKLWIVLAQRGTSMEVAGIATSAGAAADIQGAHQLEHPGAVGYSTSEHEVDEAPKAKAAPLDK